MRTEFWRVMRRADGDGADAGGGTAAEPATVLDGVKTDGGNDGGNQSGDAVDGGTGEKKDSASVLDGVEGEAKPGEGDGAAKKEGDQQAEVTDEDYAKALAPVKKVYAGEFVAEELAAMVPAFKEAGLTPEQASKLASVYAARVEQQAKAEQAAYADEVKALTERVAKEIPKEDLVLARRAIDKICAGDPVLYQTILNGVLGSHPEFIKLAAMAGRNMTGDSIPGATGGGGVPDTRSEAEILYGVNK